MTIFEIPLVAIVSHPDNPRVFRDRDEDDPALVELAASIKAVGVLEPVLVRSLDADGVPVPPERAAGYQLCAGERRLRAARLAGLTTIPAIVRDLTDDQALEVLVTENLQREDLLPLEEARGIRSLVLHGWTHEDVAAKLGRSVGWVSQRHRLNTLSPAWLQAMHNPKLAVGEWPVGHLLLVTTLAPAAQDKLLDHLGAWATQVVVERDVLRRYIGDLVRTLSAAPWKLDDAALYPEAGACSECMQRTSCNPGLFEEAKLSKADRCLDAVCWAQKGQRAVKAREAELRAKHPDLVLIDGQGYGTPVPGTIPHYHVIPAKKSTKDAVPALTVTGQEAGKVTWIMPPRPQTSRGARPTGPDGKALPKTLPERREDLRRRRIAKAVAAIAEQLPGTSAPSSFTVLRVVAIFGTDRKADGLLSGFLNPITGQWSHLDGHSSTPWGVLQKLEDPERRPTATELLWLHQVVPVLQHRLTYYSGLDIDQLWREAVQIAALSGLPFEAILEEATASLPDPKSWAHLNEDGTPKGREVEDTGVHETVHETEADSEEDSDDDPTETSTAGVCRVCGCTEDNACEMESGEPCHWVEPDLCSACVEEDTEAAE